MTAAGSTTDHVHRVRRFYDRNTARFQALGQGGASIHRAVWGPGVTTREQAFHHVEDRILALLDADHRDGGQGDRHGDGHGGGQDGGRESAPGGAADGAPDEGRDGWSAPRVVDLGCGVGGSLLHLAGTRPDLVAEGLTISPAQAHVAARLLAEAGVADRVRVREGDFLSPPDDLTGADLAFSIEAFVHGPDPAGYFRAAAGLLRPDGLLALVDDVLTPAGAAAVGRRARRVEEFRTGWRVGSLLTVDEAAGAAAAAGLRLVSDTDLTGRLELRRPRDRALAVMVALTRPLPGRLRGDYWWSLAGGHALQHCLAHGLVEYRMLVFRRTDG